MVISDYDAAVANLCHHVFIKHLNPVEVYTSKRLHANIQCHHDVGIKQSYELESWRSIKYQNGSNENNSSNAEEKSVAKLKFRI